MGVREAVRRSAIGKYKLLRELGSGATSVVHLAREIGTAFVLVTHDEALAARCGRQLRLARGKLG